MMPNSPRHYRSNRGRMGGNMMPLPHTVHAVNYVAHAQPAKEFMSMPRQPELVNKITGMLLELDNSEVVALLCSSEMLSAKVDECVQLLHATTHATKPKTEDHQEGLGPGFMVGSAGVNTN
nr:unnamed protein product [Digitaria exilis]